VVSYQFDSKESSPFLIPGLGYNPRRQTLGIAWGEKILMVGKKGSDVSNK